MAADARSYVFSQTKVVVVVIIGVRPGGKGNVLSTAPLPMPMLAGNGSFNPLNQLWMGARGAHLVFPWVSKLLFEFCGLRVETVAANSAECGNYRNLHGNRGNHSIRKILLYIHYFLSTVTMVSMCFAMVSTPPRRGFHGFHTHTIA